MTTAASVEVIRHSFPFPNITAYTGEPAYEHIKKVHDKLKADAASVRSTLGGGHHGLLGLMMTNASYFATTGVEFVLPANPGYLPVIPEAATAAQIAELVRQHTNLLRQFQETINTDRALVQLLLEIFDEEYTQAICDPNIGYANTTAMAIITHLYDSYGKITPHDLEDNAETLMTAYDPSLPITTLFKQIEDCVAYAEAGNAPFTAAQIIRKAYLLILKTGSYPEDCRQWMLRPSIEHTWLIYKAHFTLAYQTLRETQQITRSSGFHNANAAIEAMQTQAINALATANEDNTNAVANMAAANTTLATQVQALETSLRALRAENARIIRGRGQGDGGGGQGGGGGGQGGGGRGRGGRRINNSTHYCHTHGRTRNSAHTSPTCNHPGEQHDVGATFEDRRGGSTRWCEDQV